MRKSGNEVEAAWIVLAYLIWATSMLIGRVIIPYVQDNPQIYTFPGWF